MRKRNYFTLIFTLFLIISLSVEYYYEKGGDFLAVTSTMNGRELPIYSVNTDKKQIAISFDASWGNKDTSRILDILEKHKVKATFFVTGTWVDAYSKDVLSILSKGHDLGNHTTTHRAMSQLDEQTCTQELMELHNKVKELSGYDMTLFRPPYGDYDNQVLNTAKANGYYSIQWSIDSLDWKDYDPSEIFKNVCESPNLKNGAIILCHNNGKYTADALDLILSNLTAQGYEIVPISQLIYTQNYHIETDGSQSTN